MLFLGCGTVSYAYCAFLLLKTLTLGYELQIFSFSFFVISFFFFLFNLGFFPDLFRGVVGVVVVDVDVVI